MADEFWIEGADKKALNGRRDDAELLLGLADHLSPRDRALVQLVYKNGASVSALAAACEVNAATIYNRMGRILKRLKKPETQVLWRVQESIPPESRKVVMDHFIKGAAVPTLEEKYGYPKKWIYDTIALYRDYAGQQLKKSRRKD